MFLSIAAVILLIVIGVQNYLYPPLREETISDGLYGPYHWLLDGAYVILATALIYTFWDKGIASYLSWFAALCLMITAVSNTFSTWVDKVTMGKHANIHTWATIVMLLTMLSLEYITSGGKWLAWNIAVPAIVAGIADFLWFIKKPSVQVGPAAEKAGIVVLCIWLMTVG